VWDEKVVEEINKAMGRRVSLHYEQKVGLPTTCFGETRYWVNKLTVVHEIPIAPGVMVPVPPNMLPAPQPETPAVPTLPAPAPQPAVPAQVPTK
jgi:hypothetical protein